MIGSILLRTSPNPYISITIYNNDKLAYNYSQIWTFNKDVRYGFVINILLFSFLLLSFLLLSFFFYSVFFYSVFFYSVFFYSVFFYSVFFYSVFFYLVSSCSVFSCYSFLLILINYFDKITGFSKITILS
jgi:hypothetical protein